jgi:hypothetical protein
MPHWLRFRRELAADWLSFQNENANKPVTCVMHVDEMLLGSKMKAHQETGPPFVRAFLRLFESEFGLASQHLCARGPGGFHPTCRPDICRTG